MSEIKHDERYGAYMTANNAPAPLIASASQSTWGAFRAFSESLDDDLSFTGLGKGTEQWVQLQLDVPIRIWAFRICCRTTVSAKDSGQVPKNFVVQGSEDGETFEDIQSYSDMAWDQFAAWDAANNKYDWADAKKIEITCQKEYQYYRFLMGECQNISTQKAGTMTPTASNTVKLTLIDMYQVEGQPEPPEPPKGLDAYINTTVGMEVLVNNTKEDDNTIIIQGVDWFAYNNVPITNLYASGNHWIGIGSNAEHLKVCRRDGAMYNLYRQEGLLYDYYHFLKIRWEGYTYYSSTSDAYALKYEFFLFDTGDMFLNVIQTPTNSGYIGTSQLICGSNTYSLEIPSNSTPMITFTHQDDTGSTWAVAYDKINIQPPFDRKYLIQDSDNKFYTIADGNLEEITIVNLTAVVYQEYGFDMPPLGDLLKSLVNPKVLYWQDSDLPLLEKSAAVKAMPPTQTIYTTEQDLKDPSIVGVKSIVIDATENVLFAFSSDRGSFRVFNEAIGAWEDAGDRGGNTKTQVESITEIQWALLMGREVYQVRCIIPEAGSVNKITVNYKNETGVS